MRFILSITLLFLSFAGNTQPRIYNRSLTDSTLPYLYIGVDNAIEIDWKGLKPEEHRISISGGGASITTYTPGKYVVRATSVTDECIISISNKKGKVVLKNLYKVSMLNLEAVSLGGLRDSSATITRILATPFLTIGCGGCFYRYKTEILSFILTADVKESIVEIAAGGSILTAQQIELIKKADNLITIDNIRARTPDGRNVKLPGIIVYIKKDELQQNP